jgi:formylglycine-generating enzyme required for sulfatase activity
MPGGQSAPTPAEPKQPDKAPPASAAAPKVAPQPRRPAPQPRPTLAAPPSGIAIPHIVKGAAPLKMDWCWVPGGPFKMGGKQYDDEKPIHEVAVDGFWLARYPLTNAQYRLFVEAGGYNQQQWWTEAGWQTRQKEKWTEPRWWQDGKWNGAQQPVVGVSWYEALAFCAWAARATGEQIRLPAEAEWEKGARGTDGRTFPWGEAEPDAKLCNYDASKIDKTSPVGQFSPQGDSPYGCADMAGNVWDWTADWFQPYPGNNEPDDAYGEKYRVVRGGSWNFTLIGRFNLRCAYRFRFTPGNRNNNVGFRCASTAF